MNIGQNAHLTQGKLGYTNQSQLSYDSVPRALGLIGYAVGIRSHLMNHPVVHSNDQCHRGGHTRWHFIPMRNTERITRAQKHPVHPDPCLPMGPLEQQLPQTIIHLRQRDMLHIPGRADVSSLRLQPVGKAKRIGFPIGFIEGIGSKLITKLRTHPHRLSGYRIADTGKLKAPGQINCVRFASFQMLNLVPPLFDSLIIPVQEYLPST